MPVENRFLEVDDIEIRSGDDSGENEQKYVHGVGVIYDREVEVWPGFKEKIARGAFDEHLAKGVEIKSFFNHDPSQVLATTKSEPALELKDSEGGLRFKAPIPPTTYGNDLRVNLERKNVRGASFSFRVAKDGEVLTLDEKGVLHREIVKAEIYEIGPVTNPAYRQTSVSMRSEEDTYRECLAAFEEQNRTDPTVKIDESANGLKIKKEKLSLTERSL